MQKDFDQRLGCLIMALSLGAALFVGWRFGWIWFTPALLASVVVDWIVATRIGAVTILLPMRRRVPRRPSQSPASRARSSHRGTVRRKKDGPTDALRIWDISRPLGPGTKSWPGDVPLTSRSTASLGDGSAYEAMAFTMSSHLGTHVDAPAHVLPHGASVGSLDLAAFVGPARVVALTGRGEVGPDALPRECLGRPRVLFRSRGKAFLSPLAAVRLAERGALLVGTDAASIDPHDAEDLPAHRALLSRRVALLENLDLSDVEPGRLPARGASAPVRGARRLTGSRHPSAGLIGATPR